MAFIPNTDADRAAMLAQIGLAQMRDLFSDVPAAQRFPALDLPPALSEMEVMAELQAMSEENVDVAHVPSFLGAGVYAHYIPTIVNHIISRSEFFTSYTPYQPEIAQGNLQALFEYQTMICDLTGMEVANGSHYDGATSTAEAVMMAYHVGRERKQTVIMSPTVHPQYQAVTRTYVQGLAIKLAATAPAAGLSALKALIDADTACVVVQNPDFLGTLQSPTALQDLADACHKAGALLIVVANMISLGMLQPPGAYGADIVTGEGHVLGNTMSFGGPYVGVFAIRFKDVRKSSGRLAGETVDQDGERGFVLTLSTREQFIRREKATSNICTNQALNALAAAVYMAALGKQGMRKVAELCYAKAHYAAAQIANLPGYRTLNEGPFFHEFAVACPRPVQEINDFLLEEYGIIGGYDLSREYPHLANGQAMLLCVTELARRSDIDELVNALAEAGTDHYDDFALNDIKEAQEVG